MAVLKDATPLLDELSWFMGRFEHNRDSKEEKVHHRALGECIYVSLKSKEDGRDRYLEEMPL